MEEKTTANNTNDQFANLSSPFEEPPSRSPLELEQAQTQTHVDEPFWFKVLCSFGGVYPILRVNGKCNCNCKMVCWSIIPLVWTLVGLLSAVGQIIYYRQKKDINIFMMLWGFLIHNSGLPLLIFQMTLTYSQRQFSNVILEEEKNSYGNKLAKRGILLALVCNIIICVVLVITEKGNHWLRTLVNSFLTFQCSLFQVSIIVFRCLYVTHISVAQQTTKMLEIVRGPDVEAYQTKLLEINEKIQTSSSRYIGGTLSWLLFYGVCQMIDSGIRLYKHGDPYQIFFVLLFGIAIVTPLWLLTRIEKFYLLTLRNELHRNTIMPQTEQTNLLVKYDAIAPRASIFGIYITRGRVASIILTIFGAIIPKIVMYIYEHI